TLPGKITLLILVLLLTMAAARPHCWRLGEAFWLAAAALLMIRLGRFAPMFAMITAPIVASSWQKLSDRVLSKRSIIVALAAVQLLGLTKQVMRFPPRSMPLNTWLNRDDPKDLGYPTKAAEYVEQNITPRTHKLINEFTWGGYLEWRLSEYQVLLDGRTQLSPAHFWRDLYFKDNAPRTKTLAQYSDCDAAIPPLHKSKFADP